MSISAAHSEAARVNGSLSHGPSTPEGKSKSAQNAAKHRLFSATILLSPEEQAAFDELEAALFDEYSPEFPTEERCVREMVDAEWRLQRVRAHAAALQEARLRTLSETPTMQDAAEAFRLLAEESSTLSLLARYETQFRRQFDKSLQLLLDLRLRVHTDKDRIQRTMNDEEIRALHAYINAPCPYTGPQKPAAAATESPKPQAAPQNPKPPTPNLQNEPSGEIFPPRRFTNIFKNRKKNRLAKLANESGRLANAAASA